jgi:hypothetical protein
MLEVNTGKHKQRSYNGDYMAFGKMGEEKVLDWLRKRPQVLEVDDFRSLRSMQKADVDCGIYNAAGQVLLAEIKTCRHLGITPNILFETLRINHTSHTDFAGGLGWSLRSPAQWLLYYAPSVECIYQIRMSDFRKSFQTYTKEQRGNLKFNVVETDRIKSTVNTLIPYEKYTQQYTTVHTL